MDEFLDDYRDNENPISGLRNHTVCFGRCFVEDC